MLLWLNGTKLDFWIRIIQHITRMIIDLFAIRLCFGELMFFITDWGFMYLEIEFEFVSIKKSSMEKLKTYERVEKIVCNT